VGAPTSSYATADIALRVSGALKPHHHDKVETSSVGKIEPSFNFTDKNISRKVIIKVIKFKMMKLM
jgi:hypothetical protein